MSIIGGGLPLARQRRAEASAPPDAALAARSTASPRPAAQGGRPWAYLTVSGTIDTFPGNGGVAKLVIALACQAGGRGFKSRRSRSFFLRAMQVRAQRAVAQLVARSVRDRKVAGSNPVSPKDKDFKSKDLADRLKSESLRKSPV